MKVAYPPAGPVASTFVTARLKGYNMLALKEKQVRGTLAWVSVEKCLRVRLVLVSYGQIIKVCL